MTNENDLARASDFSDVADYLAAKIARGIDREQSIKKFHEMKWPLIERIARNLDTQLSDNQKEDLASESWYRALEGLTTGQYVGKGAMDAWLFRIVKNTSLELRRKFRQQVDLETAYEDISESALATQEGAPDLILDYQKHRKILHMAIESLSERQRAVVLLRLEGRSHAEIAQALHVTEAHSRKLMIRTLRLIRSIIPTEYRIDVTTKTTDKTYPETSTDIPGLTQESEQLPDVENPITLKYTDKPTIQLKGRIRSIKEGKANISIPDEEWDTFYFEV